MAGADALRPEWLAFEKELGFRPLLHGPTHEDIVRQDNENGEAITAKFNIPGPDTSVKTSEYETASGVRLKAYTPPNVKPDQPLVYFIHGGGFVIGSVDEDDRFVIPHAKGTGLTFVSVDYRLAPQHKFPAGFDDCVEGAKWCIENAELLGAKKGPIVIMGKSAGGSLAYGVALKLIDEGRVSDILGVVPCQPLTIHPDAIPEAIKYKYTSYDENSENTVNTRKLMYVLYDLYGAPANDKYTFPFLHPNLQALPRVYMNACGADTLRDDARLIKGILDATGVPNQYEEYAKLPHYFFAFPSSHLDQLRNEYFEKTAKGIAWVISR